MKLASFLSATALAGLGTVAIALLSGRHAPGLFAVAIVPLLLLAIARDLTPRRPVWRPRRAARPQPSVTPFAAETMKLAA
jgi:hypothetical protein